MSRASALSRLLRDMKDELGDTMERKSSYDHDANRAVAALAKFTSVVEKASAPDMRRHETPHSHAPEETRAQVEPPAEQLEKEFGSSAPAWVRKAFRQIALKTHPDRLNNKPDITDAQRERLIDLYRESSAAYQESKYEIVAEIAAELGIELDMPPAELEKALESKIASIRSEVLGVTKTLSWAWGTSFGDVPRRILILRRMSEVMKIVAPDEQTMSEIIRELESIPDFDIIDRLGHVRRIKSGADRRKVGTRPEKRIR